MRITVSGNATATEHGRCAALAARWGLRVVGRDALDDGGPPVLVVTRGGLRVRHRGADRGWHPGLFHTLIDAGAAHPWVRLSGLRAGHRVVDCTLGLGTDARFLAAWTGEQVVGLETVGALCALTDEGLAGVGADVRVVHADATAWLADQPDRSVDVVVADPMFPRGGRAPSLEVLRWLGDPAPVDLPWRDQALRVARVAVVLKDAVDGGLLERLEAPRVERHAGRASRWGVWRR